MKKKIYQKPTMEVTEFRFTEHIASSGDYCSEDPTKGLCLMWNAFNQPGCYLDYLASNGITGKTSMVGACGRTT